MLPLLTKAGTALDERLRARCFVDLSRDPSSSVLVLSDARSGSTWVADLINHRQRFRYMFEPFHPRVVKPAARAHMFQYIAPDDEAPDFQAFSRRVLTGAFRYQRVDRYNRRLVSSERLIKDVTANLFAGWLHARFPEVKIVLLLRHPFGVAVSKQATSYWSWPGVAELTAQPSLVGDFLKDHIADAEAERDPLLEQVWVWSVLHAVPFQQLDPARVHLAFYESFCENPERELERVFTFIDGENGTAGRVGPDLDADKPSVMARGDSAARSGKKPIGEWQRHFDDRRMARGREILERFGLGDVYPGTLPDRDAATSLLSRS